MSEMPIGNDLIAAYKGYYADEWALLISQEEPFVLERVRETIIHDTPKKRLEIYLAWNGIIGHTNRIWEITQGEL